MSKQKTLTIDFDLYEQELQAAKTDGFNQGLKLEERLIKIIKMFDIVGVREYEIKNALYEILETLNKK